MVVASRSHHLNAYFFHVYLVSYSAIKSVQLSTKQRATREAIPAAIFFCLIKVLDFS